MAARWESALLPVLALGVPPVVTTAPTTSPTVVTVVPTDPTVPAITTPTVSPTVTSRFGARTYRIGSAPTRTISAGPGAAGVVARSSRSFPGAQGAATAIAPPATPFARWYPATRWSAGIR